MSKEKSVQDSLPKHQNSDQPGNNNRKVCRAFSVGLPPYLDLLRCDSGEVSGTPDDRRLVRSQPESNFSLQAWRKSSWTMDLRRSQEIYCSSGKEAKKWKLPSIPRQRNEATANLSVDDFEELSPMTSTMPRRSSLCVLPDLSKGLPRAFRAATPLRKQQVEEVNNNFDSLKSKSQNLAKWLRDQQ